MNHLGPRTTTCVVCAVTHIPRRRPSVMLKDVMVRVRLSLWLFLTGLLPKRKFKPKTKKLRKDFRVDGRFYVDGVILGDLAHEGWTKAMKSSPLLEINRPSEFPESSLTKTVTNHKCHTRFVMRTLKDPGLMIFGCDYCWRVYWVRLWN